MKKAVIFLAFVLSLSAESIVCSFSILQNLCKQLCQNTPIQVDVIVPNGIDPHLFQPKPSDSKKIMNADLVIINGLELEGWLEGMVKGSGYKGELLIATNHITPRYFGTLPDPHVWHDPLLVITMVKNIKNGLVKKFPLHRAQIINNAMLIEKEFRSLHQQIKLLFKKIPKEKKQMLTTHDAFSYFAKRYELTVYSPQGINTGDDPSAKDLKKLIERIRNHNIRAIFLEHITSPKIIRMIVNETHTSIQGILYADTLKEGASLQETIQKNATIIAAAMC